MSSLLSWATLLSIRPIRDGIKISMVKLSGEMFEDESAGSRNVDVLCSMGAMSVELASLEASCTDYSLDLLGWQEVVVAIALRSV